MRVVVVDDEAPARAKLKRMLLALDADPERAIEVVGEAADGTAALELVARTAPDAVFLDVQMPEVGGLDVAASLPDDGPAVVFVTAFDRYALQAFEVDAVDYLLKPVDPDRLARAVERLRARPPRAPTRAAQRLLIVDRGRTHVVRFADIEWLEAADNYVTVHTSGSALLLRRTLAGLLADLGAGFVRTHRSAAVALAFVVEVQARDKGDATVVLKSGATVPCSRQHRADLLARLQP